MMSKPYRTILLCCCFLQAVQADAQTYPKDYFQSPMDIPLKLAGNFGECRPDHFHTGLDFKTQQRENINIYSAADGYVSRINISHTGYGYSLYINHPNGFQTVYAHLNDYAPEIKEYVRRKQYELEKWNIDIEIPEGALPVRKGSLIALSGNTGGSTAPHLHFEIRELSSGAVINPSLFGFNIQDRLPPVIKSIAIYDAGSSIYQQRPVIIAVKKSGAYYEPVNKNITVPFRQARIGVMADDYMNGSNNALGVFQMELFVNQQPLTATRLEKILFEENRYMNAYADFKTYKSTGKWYQGLYRLPYNKLSSVYSGGDGTFEVHTTSDIEIQLTDAYGNRSRCRFSLTGSGDAQRQHCRPLSEHVIQLEDTGFQFRTAVNYIYDPICWEYTINSNPALADGVRLMDADVPLHSYSRLALRLKKFIPFELRNKLIFVHKIKAGTLPGANPQTAMAARFENGWVVADVRTFGDFAVSIDTTAPAINSALDKNKNIKAGATIHLTITEKTTSISRYSVHIDGRWECFSRKGDRFSFTLPTSYSKGAHRLKVVAWDENQNRAEKEWTFSIQ